MTAKEKAEELFNKIYYSADEDGFHSMNKYRAKQCTLKAVDEIIRLANRSDLFKMRSKSQHMEKSPVDETYVEYWDEVKTEIEKL